MINPYEPPQQKTLSSPAKKGDPSLHDGNREKLIGRIIIKYLLFGTPMIPLIGGIMGAIVNPNKFFSGVSRTRTESFLAYFFPFDMGLFSLILWTVFLAVVTIACLIRPLMRMAIPFLAMMGFAGCGLILIAFRRANGSGDEPAISPILFSVSVTIVIVAVLSALEISRKQL
jgi:hypothetical protein